MAKSTVQNVADWVGAIARAQEEIWEYALPELDEQVTTVVLSLYGAYLRMKIEQSSTPLKKCCENLLGYFFTA